MNLLKMYFQEKYGTKFIEHENGYIMYNVYDDKSVYIRHLYIKPEVRNTGLGKELEDKLIEKENPIAIFCDIDLKANNPEQALGVIMHKANYKIDQVNESFIVMRKEF